jgi:hypothetical protein
MQESVKDLTNLYDSRPKPDDAAKWRAELPPEETAARGAEQF